MSDAVMQLLESGYQAQQSGDAATAEARYQEVLKREPQNVHALNLMGMLCVNNFRAPEAVKFISNALQQVPDNPQSHTNLGLAYKDIGEPQKAIDHFRRSIELDASNPDVYNNLGNVLRVVDRPKEAITEYERALKMHPTFAECWSNLSAALNESGQQERALTAASRAIELDPDLAQAYNNRGDIHLELAQYEQAIAEYKRAVELSPKYVAALLNMARTQRDMDDPDAARQTLKLAIEIEPNNPEAFLVEGVLNEQIGDRSAAAESFKKSIAQLPEMTVAHYYLSQIKGRKGTDDEFAAMRELAKRQDLTPKARTYLEFGLFRAYDQRGMYDEAYAHLATGNAIKAETSPYDDEDTAEYIESILECARSARDKHGASPGLIDPRPVFVLGMPRSGTSLTEQILASHSEVAGAGELSYAYDTAHSIRKMVNEKFPDNMKLLSAEQFAELGDRYLSRHSEQSLAARFVVDKTPLNFQYIGMLALALPQARFIHCHRDPVANCFSIHRMPFDDKQTYAHNLESLGTYYSRYWNLMLAWHDMFPGRILDCRYEDTVDDIESQSRRILDFLDLEFEEQVLEFHKTKRIVKTPSASQVRQPIYKDSVAAWKHYEKHLQPLIQSLTVKP